MSRIEEIKGRLEVITPGEWRVYKKELGAEYEYEWQVAISQFDTTVVLNDDMEKADAAFIASAPDDMRYLLNEIEHLQGLLTIADELLEREDL